MVFRSLQYALTKIAQKTERPVNASRDGIFSVTENKTQRKSRPQGRIFAGVPSNVLLLLLVISSALMPSHVAATTSTAVDTKASSITEQPRQFNIPRQRADGALTAFGQQADLTVVYQYDRIKNYHTNQLQGDYKVTHAVAILLANTGLSAEFDAVRYLIITDQSKGKRMNTANSSKRKTVLAGLVGLFAAGGMTQAVAQGGEAATGQSAIDEIIVTANKREQSLQDTAMSIGVLSQKDIGRNSYIGMGDYLATIPGVSQSDLGPGVNRLSMRGISASAGDETTVGVYLGEASLNTAMFGGVSGDIKLIDIERIEILRGPQGTLFGSGTMGGVVRNIPNAPNLEEFEAEVQLGLSSTDRANGANNKTTGVINIPLVDNQLALRVVAYHFKNEGYIDMVSATDPALIAKQTAFGGELDIQKGVGDSEFTGGRASLLWQATENLAVTLTHVEQDLAQVGLPLVTIDKGSYRDAAFGLNGLFDGRQGRSDDTRLTNLVVTYDTDWGELIYASAASKSDIIRSSDFGVVFPWPVAGKTSINNKNYTQELRFSSQLSGPFQFLAGVYYEDIQTHSDNPVAWSGDTASNFFGTPTLIAGPDDTDIKQKALFGEVSYDISEQLKLTLGGRWFDYDRTIFRDLSGPLFTSFFDIESNESGDTGKINLAYTSNDNTLVYVQWAQGFRLGKPVVVPPLGQCDVDNDGILDGTTTPINTDGALDSDNLDSFELGSKFSFLDNQLTVNAAIYHIDWEGIPVHISPVSGNGCPAGTDLNAGKARSQGLEIETNYRMSEQLRLYFGVGYNDAELSEDAPGLGLKGDRLPLNPRFNTNIGLDYTFDLGGHEGFIHANYAYVGGYHSDLAESSTEAGDYSKLNLRVGVTIDHWRIEAFGTNMTNADELVGLEGSFRGARLTPRQIGLDIGYTF